MKKAIQQAVMGVAVAIALAIPGTSFAQSRGGPRTFVEARHTAVNRLLQVNAPAGSPQATQRDGQVTRILNTMLDLDELSRRALEPYWAERTATEKQEFTGLLRQLIERNYRQNLNQSLAWGVTYEPEQIDDTQGTAVVRTVARSRTDARAAPVTIEYRLHRRGANDWVVYDIVTNGSSLVQTYHDSYTRIIRERGFAELMNRLRTRVRSPATANNPA